MRKNFPVQIFILISLTNHLGGATKLKWVQNDYMLRTSLPLYPSSKRRRKARTHLLTVRRFQYHYAFFLVSFGVIMALLVGGGTLYLLNHNYHLLMKSELINAPRIVDNLDRERKLANEMIVGAFVGFIIFLGLLGIKFSHAIVVPIYLIQEKMRQLCRGDTMEASVRIRASDEFQEFAETYNYLVESLRVQIQLDVQRLLQLKPDEKNRDATHIWQCMLHEKNSQLSGTEFSSTDPTAFERHVS
jgi:hypothetical protein